MNLSSLPRFMRFLAVTGLVSAVCWGLGCAPAYGPGSLETGYTRDRGVIKGAHFKVLAPDNWTGDLLVRAHGYRPLSAPLQADLDLKSPGVAELLAQGWLVAATSYRRNGLIIADAQEDLNNLIAAIVRKYGPCRRILIEGSSMGANIALLMAEQQGGGGPVAQPSFAISGIIALGAAPDAEDETGPFAWSHVPRLPVLFVSNQSEIDAVQAYARHAYTVSPRPAVWMLARDGHVNINVPERLAAIAAVAAWVAGEMPPAGDGFDPHDATVVIHRQRTTADSPGAGVWGRVAGIDEIFGNVDLTLGHEDLLAQGLELGNRVSILCGEVFVDAVWGTTYADVGEGEVVVFVTADGGLRVAVNRGHAAARLGCRAGDTLKITASIESLPCGN